MMSECNTHWQANVIRVSWHMECIKAEQFTEFILLFILFWVTVFAQCGKKNLCMFSSAVSRKTAALTATNKSMESLN